MIPRSVREAAAAVRRAPLLTLVSVVAIGLSLFLLGLFVVTAFNIDHAIERIEERVEVLAYLRDDVEPAQVALATREMGALPEVAAVRHVSKEQALERAARDMAEFREVFADLEVNPLPASLELRMRSGFRTTRAVEAVAAHLSAYPFVEEVDVGRDWVAQIMALRRIAAGATAILGGAFAVVAAIIIATAVRMAVFARREEIAIMRMVGATHGFIRRPFLLEGLAAGLLGGALAVGLTFGAYRFVGATLLQIDWIPTAWAVAGVALGALFGLLASALAVRQHLRGL